VAVRREAGSLPLPAAAWPAGAKMPWAPASRSMSRQEGSQQPEAGRRSVTTMGTAARPLVALCVALTIAMVHAAEKRPNIWYPSVCWTPSSLHLASSTLPTAAAARTLGCALVTPAELGWCPQVRHGGRSGRRLEAGPLGYHAFLDQVPQEGRHLLRALPRRTPRPPRLFSPRGDVG
jgi:hypothetical protein